MKNAFIHIPPDPESYKVTPMESGNFFAPKPDLDADEYKEERSLGNRIFRVAWRVLLAGGVVIAITLLSLIGK